MAYVDTGTRFLELELRIKSSPFLMKLQTGFTKSRCIVYIKCHIAGKLSIFMRVKIQERGKDLKIKNEVLGEVS